MPIIWSLIYLGSRTMRREGLVIVLDWVKEGIELHSVLVRGVILVVLYLRVTPNTVGVPCGSWN